MKRAIEAGAKTIASLASIAFLVSAYSPATYAGTGLCVTGLTSSVWELKVVNCSGNDCAVEIDRTNFQPIPSAGSFNIGSTPMVLNWEGGFSGSTQGWVSYSCALFRSAGLPFGGTGMRQRNASFTGGTAEYLTGDCVLDLCTNLSAGDSGGADEDTQP
jgi:hypothetical protein